MNAVSPPWFQVGEDAVRLLRDGEQAFPAMLQAIVDARREILLEMYWIGTDAVGERFREALRRRARDGIVVRVIYDALGSLTMGMGFWQPLLSVGGEVVEFHSISPLAESFRVERVEQRNHRKMLIVDGETGFTGGLNLSAQWLPIRSGGQGWRDDVIEVRGKAPQEMRTLFYRTWRRITRRSPVKNLAPLPDKPERPVFLLGSQKNRSIHREYRRRIANARRSVDIANSYFVPDRSVRNALYRAVRRGVRVRVLVPEKCDVPLIQFAIEALFDTLMRHLVEVYVLPGPMLHSKTAIVDDFATIGSYNLDERSWRKNLEANLAVEDAAFAEHVRRWFDHDCARATRLDLTKWRTRSLTRRGIEWFARGLEKLW